MPARPPDAALSGHPVAGRLAITFRHPGRPGQDRGWAVKAAESPKRPWFPGFLDFLGERGLDRASRPRWGRRACLNSPPRAWPRASDPARGCPATTPNGGLGGAGSWTEVLSLGLPMDGNGSFSCFLDRSTHRDKAVVSDQKIRVVDQWPDELDEFPGSGIGPLRRLWKTQDLRAAQRHCVVGMQDRLNIRPPLVEVPVNETVCGGLSGSSIPDDRRASGQIASHDLHKIRSGQRPQEGLRSCDQASLSLSKTEVPMGTGSVRRGQPHLVKELTPPDQFRKPRVRDGALSYRHRMKGQRMRPFRGVVHAPSRGNERSPCWWRG